MVELGLPVRQGGPSRSDAEPAKLGLELADPVGLLRRSARRHAERLADEPVEAATVGATVAPHSAFDLALGGTSFRVPFGEQLFGKDDVSVGGASLSVARSFPITCPPGHRGSKT